MGGGGLGCLCIGVCGIVQIVSVVNELYDNVLSGLPIGPSALLYRNTIWMFHIYYHKHIESNFGWRQWKDKASLVEGNSRMSLMGV